MSTFNIGNQSGGVVNNVGGDQHVSGGQQGVWGSGDPAAIIQALRAALDRAGLPAEVQAAARIQVEQLDRAVSADPPDKAKAATALNKLTRTLLAARPLVAASAALVAPITALAGWLGPLAASIPHLVSML